MASYNHVVIVGNLTRDPEVKYLPNGTSVCELGIAVNRTWKDKNSGEKKEETSFFDVSYFGRTAEICGEYLHKGSSILVDGELKQDRWEDKETGKNRSKVIIRGRIMQMMGGKGSDNGGGGGGYQSAPQQQPSGNAYSGPAGEYDAPAPDTDDVPF